MKMKRAFAVLLLFVCNTNSQPVQHEFRVKTRSVRNRLRNTQNKNIFNNAQSNRQQEPTQEGIYRMDRSGPSSKNVFRTTPVRLPITTIKEAFTPTSPPTEEQSPSFTSDEPTSEPTSLITDDPTSFTTNEPTDEPSTNEPTIEPTIKPTTAFPTTSPPPSSSPSASPSSSFLPSSPPTITCPTNSHPIDILIQIKTDSFFEESSYEVVDAPTNAVLFYHDDFGRDHHLHTFQHKVCSNACFRFTIYDSYGDGLNDGSQENPGLYRLFFGEDTLRNKSWLDGYEESTTFGEGCPTVVPSSHAPSGLKSKEPSVSPSSKPSTSSAPTSMCATEAVCSGVLTFYGETPGCLLPECAGHCETDGDCAGDGYCWKAEGNVPGCETVPYRGVNYCVSGDIKPSSVPSSEPTEEPTYEPSTAEPTHSNQCQSKWSQLGQKLGKKMGTIAMASSALVIAVRVKKNRIRVYNFDDILLDWEQIGKGIDSGLESFEHTVALSSDGTIVAIGDPEYDSDRGRVMVYAHHYKDGWIPLGFPIEGESIEDKSGGSIILSADGITIAIGASGNDGNSDESGHVRVYIYNTETNLWIQKGDDIDGETSGDQSAWSIAMSSDGGVVAVGSPRNNGNGVSAGHVRVFGYNIKENRWIQRGGDIDGEAKGDRSGCAIDLSADGFVVAIGAEENKAGGGHVRVWEYITSQKRWVRRGEDIDGEIGYRLGSSVAMSADGTALVIGAEMGGSSRVYRLNSEARLWYPQGEDLVWGSKVAMSSDGEVITVYKSGKKLQVLKWTTCLTASRPSAMPSYSEYCLPGTTKFRINLTTDRFPKQTTWDLKLLGSEPIHRGGPYDAPFTPYTEAHCLAQGCYCFTIYDSSSDGICCDWLKGNGKYEVYYDSFLVQKGGNFTSKENSILFGSNCPTSLPSTRPTLSMQPSKAPSIKPSATLSTPPTLSMEPSEVLSKQPSYAPTARPTFTMQPSELPTNMPSRRPSNLPTISLAPSDLPSNQPTGRCPEGTFRNETLRECQNCVPGTYRNRAMSSENCVPCDAGTHQPDEGKTECISCKKGMYQEAVGQAQCKECREGGYCNTNLTGTCDGGFTPCKIGTYNDKKGQAEETACRQCPRGQFSDKAGLAECLTCPYRLGSYPNSTECSFCDEGFYLIDPKADPEAILQRPSVFCEFCPENVDCPINTTVETLEVSDGFWRDSLSTATVYACKYEGICRNQGAYLTLQMQKTDAKLMQQIISKSPSSLCIDGHSGPLCEICDEGKYLDKTNGQCSDCPRVKRFVLIFIVFITICVILTTGYISITRIPNIKTNIDKVYSIISCISLQAKLKIFLSFYQVVSILETVYGVRMHDRFKAWFEFLCYFQLRILNQFVPHECLGSMKVQLVLSSLWPFILLIILIVGIALYAIYRKSIAIHGSRLRHRILLQSVHITIIVIYVSLPTVSNSIFDAIRCKPFVTDDNADLNYAMEKSYLVEDWSIECDTNKAEYKDVLYTFWILFVIWPVIMPLIFARILWQIRKSVRLDQNTDMSEACRFLWRDYNKNMMFWEVLDVFRKIILTGLIMFVDKERGSERLTRLVIATAISTIYLGLLALTRPYKHTNDLHLSFTSNILLIGCFLMGIIIHICNKGDDNCQSFIGIMDAYNATLLAVILTVGMLIISVIVIIFLARTSVPTPTIQVSSTRARPNIEMREGCNFHLFLSHVWSTGQDKTHSFARILQLHLPGIRVWLDVDELKEIGALEKSVENSEVFVLIYSKGYFRSENCCRELKEAVAQNKPIIIIYEGNESNIEGMKDECRVFFPHNKDSDTTLQCILKENPILWLGGSAHSFAMESVKLVVLRLLKNLPYYTRNGAELNQGLEIGNKLNSSSFSFPKRIISCKGNKGVESIIEELKEKVNGSVSFIDDDTFGAHPGSDKNNDVLLLYLNKDLFQDAGGVLSSFVLKASQDGIKIVLVEEKDTNKGHCEFSQHLSHTPTALLTLGLFDGIAVPLYTAKEYRAVSIYLVLNRISVGREETR